MSLKLIRRTANGDLQLEGLPLYIAGTVSSVADLPLCGEAAGECFWVEEGHSKNLYLWNGECWNCTNSSTGNSDEVNTAIDSEAINKTLLQTGFPAIN